MVAYTQTLQFWAEKVDLPTEGKPHLLAESAIELWEEMEYYLSFSNKDVFRGVALPEEAPKEVTPQSTWPTLAGTPVKEATVDMTMELAMEKRPLNKFLGWEKMLHPQHL